jgi:hypothetical protein
MSNSPIVTIAGLVVLAFFVIFGAHYGVLAMGSTSVGVNDTNLGEYAPQYHAGVNASITSISLVNQTPLLISIMIIVAAVLGLAIIIKGKRRY